MCVCVCLFKYSSELCCLPWSTKIKSVYNKVKLYKIFFLVWWCRFVLLLLCQILKYRKYKSAKGSYSIAMLLKYTGVSLCATSYYLPRAYNALLGSSCFFVFWVFFYCFLYVCMLVFFCVFLYNIYKVTRNSIMRSYKYLLQKRLK